MGKAKGRVLIVEDEALIQMMLQEFMESEGYTVEVADTVDGAVRLIQSGLFDAAVIDMNLNGDLASPVLRALRHAHVPCVLASGYSKETLPEEFENIPHIAKPYQLAEVMASVEDCVKARAARPS